MFIDAKAGTCTRYQVTSTYPEECPVAFLERDDTGYLEAEFAKQHDLLSALVSRSLLPSSPMPWQPSEEESSFLLTAPDEDNEEPGVHGEVHGEGHESQQEEGSSGERESVDFAEVVRPSRAKKETLFWKTSELQMQQAQHQASQLTRVRRAHVSESERERTWRTRLEGVVKSERFSNLIMALIMANVILMGIEAGSAKSSFPTESQKDIPQKTPSRRIKDASGPVPNITRLGSHRCQDGASAVRGIVGEGFDSSLARLRCDQDDIPDWFNTVNVLMVAAFVAETVLKPPGL
ncbi:CACNA1G [Symbiodinium natans]|uniref:CACNA1G protein n=1 Tax=Symbiodinium natans TaxID=878477 RepID=A0A812R2T4_9DINO|nr:CACNA1G [Symbiodinium natans]